MLCGAQVGDFCNERQDGGVSIGKVTFSSLAFVDDIANANHKVMGVHNSHDCKFFL